MNRSENFSTVDQANERNAQRDTAATSQESRASVVELESLSCLNASVASSHLSHSSLDSLSMRLVSQKKDFIDKLKKLSITPHIFLQSYSDRLHESIVVKKTFSEKHPFSDQFQEIFKVRSQESNAVHQKKEQALKEFLAYIRNSIQEKYSFLSVAQFNDRSTTKNLAVYLVSRVDDERFHYLISELTYFYQSILEMENEEVVKVAFSIFPPSNVEDFQCLEGTRARLLSAIAYMKDHMSEVEGMSLKSMLDQRISQAGECVIDDTIVKENLRFLLPPSVEVHSKNFLSYLSGVSSGIIEKKDSYYLTPLVDFPASIAYDFLSNFRKNLNSYTFEYKKILIDQFEIFFNEVHEFNDENSSLPELSDHFFLQYIRSLDPDFDLRSEQYLLPKDEYYFSFLLNKEHLLSSVFSILENSLSGNQSINENFISLLDAYDTHASSKIKSLILSDDLNKAVSAIHILYVLGERFKGSSPARFISILLDLTKELPAFNQEPVQVITQFFYSLSRRFISHSMYSSEREKIDKISSRFEYYLSSPREPSDQFENLISYRLGKSYSYAGLFFEYIQGGGSLYEFQSFDPVTFNREAKKINNLLFIPKNIPRFIFHPELKELIKQFFPYLAKDSIEKIIYYSVFFNQDNRLIDLMQDDFFKASVPCIDTKTQKSVLNLVFHRKNYLLAEKLLEVGFHPKQYMDINEEIATHSREPYQYNNFITICAKDKQFSLLAKLIERGIKIDDLSLSEPFSLFRMAFDLGDVHLLNFLFDHGLKVEKIKFDLSVKVCHEVAMRNLAHFIPVLMKNGFSMNHFMEQEGRGMTAVNIAAKKGFIAVIEKLLEADLPEEAFLERDVNFYSAFAYLMMTNNLNAIEALLKHGFSLDKLLMHQVGLSEHSTLQYLVYRGKFEIFNFLCGQLPEGEAHHYLSQKSKDGETLAHFAVKNVSKNTKQMIEILCRHLTNDEIAACDHNGKNLFHILADLPSCDLTPEKMEDSVNLLRFLSDFINPDSANVFDQSGYAPVHIAAMNGNFAMVSALFDQFKLSPEVLNKKIGFHFWQKNQTIAEHAMSQGHVELARKIEIFQGPQEDVFESENYCFIL